MIKITHPSQCSGCTACASICGHDAITMKADSLGFKYPEVDVAKCIECGQCEKICPFKPDYETDDHFETPEVMAIRLTDEFQLKQSQSGGAFTAFSDVILSNGGVIYGVTMDSVFRAVYDRAQTAEQRDKMRGSKYVQASIDGIFKNVRADLLSGITVAFFGTPCQVAGLRAFIPPKLRTNLFLIDIICHGVPAPAIWSDYLNYLETKHNDKIIEAKFRDKSIGGWRVHRESYTFSKGEKIIGYSYTYLFYEHLVLRESCFDCKFCNTRRPGDLTIGDFWGAEKIDEQLAFDGKGLSVVLVSSAKGKTLLERSMNNVQYLHVPLDAVLQPNLRHPSKRPKKRGQFQEEYSRRGFRYVFFKYGQDGWRYKLHHKLQVAKSLALMPIRKIKKTFFNK